MLSLRATATPSGWEDALLVWRLRAGSGPALARIYEKHRHGLLRIALGLLADPDAAEDVVQDVFLRIARDPGIVRGDGNLRAFLATCVANHARNTNRGIGRRGAPGDTQPDDIPGPDASPAHWLVRHDDMLTVTAALAELPEEQREAVVLHLQGGMRFREIAAATGTSINTIHSRYRYALAKLSESMKEDA